MAIDLSKIFTAKSVPAATQTELEGRATKTWSYFGQAKTWIHVMSLCQGFTDEEYHLTTFKNYSDAYDTQYNRPKYAIQSLKVSTKGEYGTTKSATLELTFFTDEALNKFAAAYLIPDMSVRVQWGWSVDHKGTPPGFQPYTEPAPDTDSIRWMKGWTETYPNYEGYQGHVMGWNVDLDPKDNVWKITLDLVGASDAVTEMPAVATGGNCKCEKTVTGQTGDGENEEQEIVEESSALTAALLEIWDDANNINTIKQGINFSGAEFIGETIQYPGFSRDETGEEDSSGFLFIDADLDAEETFITWGTVETLFSYFSGQQATTQGPASFVLDSGDLVVKVPTHDGGDGGKGGRWFSADPRVCILPGQSLQFQKPTSNMDPIDATVDVVSGVASAALNAFTFGLAGQSPAEQAASYGTVNDNCFKSDNEIILRKIRVSTIHIIKRLKDFETNAETMMSAIKSLLKDINDACGGVWELELLDITDARDGNVPGVQYFAVVDVNAPEYKNNPFNLKATPGNGGFCREVKIDFKPTDAMKTQALYSNGNASAGEFQGNSKTPCASRFMQYAQSAEKVSLGKTPPKDLTQNRLQEFCSKLDKCNPEKEADHVTIRLEEEAVGVNIDAGKVYLREQRRKADMKTLEDEKQVSGYCASTALPISFGATLSGVGGFGWGQSVTCDRLPQDIRTIFNFQITKVEHNITPDDWTTSFETVARKLV